MKKYIFLSFLLISVNLVSQSEDKKWAVGANLGSIEYYGDLGSELFTFINNHGTVGLNVSRYINSSLDVSGNFVHGLMDFDGLKGSFETSIFDYNVLAKYKFNNGYLLKEDFILAPYIAAGFGATYSVSEHYDNGNGNAFDFGFPGAIGLEVRVTESISVELRSLIKYSLSDEIDNNTDSPFEQNYGDMFVYHSIGFVYSFGCGKKATEKTTEGEGN